MVIDGIRITPQIERLFAEAQRRYVMFNYRDNEPLATSWIGLGMASEYKPAVKAGLMESHGKYAPRCLGWFLFTDKGLQVFAAWLAIKNFKEAR
jgi:hypothetical protein